nr:hypothetical protein [Desulfuromonadales bacterium]
MDNRQEVEKSLRELEQNLRELQVRYEQYFAGAEKLEPVKLRDTVSRTLRQFANRRIVQTDLRFRCQNLATRYHTYASQWDRVLRLMDEGKYVRQLSRNARKSPAGAGNSSAKGDSDIDSLYKDLVQAHRSCKNGKQVPQREQVASFLEKQKSKLREKYGDRNMQFQVVTENGKPKIKVKAKK